LTPEQEIELAGKIKKGDPTAGERMILSNLRLVVTIAHDYVDLGLSLLDLISEGNIGLTKAVERFDPTKRAKLSTNAAWWIKQSIKRALANQSKTIRLPVHLVDKIAKVRRVSLQMSDELGREPTDEELGEEIGIASGKVAKLKSLGIRPVSLDTVVGDEDSAEFSEMIGDEDAETPFESLRQEFAPPDGRTCQCPRSTREKNHFAAFRPWRWKTEDAGRHRQEFSGVTRE
jgi:RNA polymerase primary sigma factor